MVEQSKGGGDQSADKLDGFLREANRFVKNTFTDMVESVPKAKERPLLEGSVETLVMQFQSMTAKVHRAYAEASTSTTREVDEFLELQQGSLIACNTQRTAVLMIKSEVTDALLVWLARNLQEIKKIIRMILRIINKVVPPWYDDIALLIDELAHIVLGLFASISGLNATRVAEQLSKGEQNFWAEMGALDRVAAMRTQMRRQNDE